MNFDVLPRVFIYLIILLPFQRFADSLELHTHSPSHAPEPNLSHQPIQYAFIVLKNGQVNTWSDPSIIRKSQCLHYLSQLLIRISSDCHPNPGPRPPKYPCLSCQRAVKNNQNSVQCETCEQWWHADCLSMSANRFDVLTEYSFAWLCPKCDSQYVTQCRASDTSDLSTGSLYQQTAASFEDLSDPDSSLHSLPDGATCSLPRQYQQVKTNNLSVIVVNTQSIMAKKESLWQIIESQRPDLILASETWLKSDIHDCRPRL